MAKKKAPAKKAEAPNKSQLIRDYLAAHPTAKNLEVAHEVSKMGVKCLPQDVANQKTLAKKKAGKSDRKISGFKAATNAPTIDWGKVQAVIAFVKAAGGVPAARALLEGYAAVDVPF